MKYLISGSLKSILHINEPRASTRPTLAANNLIHTMSAFDSDNAVVSFANTDPYVYNLPQLAVVVSLKKQSENQQNGFQAAFFNYKIGLIIS